MLLPQLSPNEVIEKIDEFFKEGHMKIFQNDLSKDRRSDVTGQKADSQDRSLNNGITLMVGGHQYCMDEDLRINVGNLITPLLVDTTKFACFEDIFELMRKNISDISGIGPLALYDISLRIAWSLAQKTNDAGKRAIMPREYVYLQSGSLSGAMTIFNRSALLNKCEIICDSTGKPNGGYRIKRDELANLFQYPPIPGFAKYWDPDDTTIPAWIIEDILCVKFHNGSYNTTNCSGRR